MPCYHPITGYRSQTLNENGKRPIVFNRRSGFIDMQIELPCGRCIGCKLERSRQWATRITHEAQLHDQSCFITLTYSPENLPQNGSLDLSHYQNFMKRFRSDLYPKKIRFFHCGEYGELNLRPHYHAIIFGHDWADKRLLKSTDGNTLYTSQHLEELWGLGMTSSAPVTFESAAYVARYCTKKINGPNADAHYQGRKPEYCTMSRRPGIGHNWIQRFNTDVYPRDYVVTRGTKSKPPRFYDNYTEQNDPLTMEKIKATRHFDGIKNSKHPDHSYRRLLDREQCAKAKLDLHKRPLD